MAMEPTRPEVIRGIPVFKALKILRGGCLRRGRGQFYSLSQRTPELAQFWSHSWRTSPLLKYRCVLYLNNGLPAFFVGILFSLTAACLYIAGILPATAVREGVDCVWCTPAGALGYLVGLLIWKRRKKVFLDVACIDQTNQKRKAEGLVSMGAFLKSSESLLVLWDLTYTCDYVGRLLNSLKFSAVTAGLMQETLTKCSQVERGPCPGPGVIAGSGRLQFLVETVSGNCRKGYAMDFIDTGQRHHFGVLALGTQHQQWLGQVTVRFWQANDGVAGKALNFPFVIAGDGGVQAYNFVLLKTGVAYGIGFGSHVTEDMVVQYPHFLAVCGGDLGFFADSLEDNGLLAFFAGGSQVGILMVVYVCLGVSSNDRPGWRQGLRGVRVGEASHPGPGGGAAATANRREEKKVHTALVSIIELLLSIVAGLAGDDHPAKHQVAGIKSLLNILRDTEDDDDEAEPPATAPPWRQITIKDAPQVVPIPAQGAMRPLSGGKKGGGKRSVDGVAGDDKGKGKSNKGAAEAKANGKATSNQSGKGKGTAQAGNSGGGKTRQAQSNPKDAKKPGMPALRPKDWSCNIMDYDSACSQLHSLGDTVLITVKDEEQADALMQMLMGASTQCSARMVWRAADGALKAPVEVDGDVRVETFGCVDYTTAGKALPTLKRTPPTPKKVPESPTTTTLRAVFAKEFLAKDAWTKATSTPRVAVQKWCREVQRQGLESFVKDAWGFAQETRLGLPAVVGLIRVPLDKAADILQLSGEKGVFLEPAGRDNAVPCEVQWIEELAGETWAQLLSRAQALKPKYGVFLGKRQVGIRAETATKGPSSRVRFFSVKDTSASWTDELVSELVEEQTPLREVAVHKKISRRSQATWILRARAEDASEVYQLQIVEGGVNKSLWVLPVRGEAARSSKPIADRGAFVFSRPPPCARGPDKPEPKSGDKATEVQDGPPSKKAAISRKQRAIPDGVAVDKVDGDGNCFFAVIGKAVGRLRGEPARKAAQVRAEVCAHLRKHRESYEAFWNGKDSHDAPLGDFEDYVKHMSENGRWAGSLEAYAAAKAYKVAVYVVPSPVDIQPAAYNSGAVQKVALWYTEHPGHFDWLCPTEGTDLPEALLALAKSTQPGDFPRGGAKNAEKTDAETEHTYFTHFGINAGGDGAVSERTTFTNDNVVTKPVEVADDAASVGAPSESTVFTKKEVQNRTIQDWFVQARRASSDAVTGFRSTASASAFDQDLEDDTIDTAADEVIPPVTVRRWRGVTRREAHSSWRCPECGWSTGRTKYWCRVKAAHIAKFHPDLKKELNLRERAIKLVPYSAATCCWKCPVDGCDMGLPAVDSTTDARRWARRRHAATEHPDKPIGLFLLKMGTAAKAHKATMAKLSAGAAQRIQQLKAGEAGDHDVVCVKLPPAKLSEGSKGKKRRAVTRVVCKQCKRIAANPKAMAAHPCRTTSAGAKRPGLLKRLRDTRDRGNLEPDIQAGTDFVLNLFAVEEPRPELTHQPKALAWPVDTRNFVVKFVCPTCGGVWTRLRDVEGKPCDPSRKRARYAEAAQLRQLANTQGAVGEAAVNILSYLREKGVNKQSEARAELARGLGQHA